MASPTARRVLDRLLPVGPLLAAVLAAPAAHADTVAVSTVTEEALAALPWPPAPGSGVADALAFAQVVRQDFRSCRQDARPDTRLNELAGRLLRGFKVDRAAFGAAGLPVKAAGMVVVPRLTSWERVRDSLANQCGQRVGYPRFGVAVEGGRAALVYARPAELDLGARAVWEQELLRRLNEARRQGQRCGDTLHPGVGPLAWDGTLSRAAAQHAAELPQYDFRGHVNPVTGSTPPTRAAAAGWPDPEVAETLAYDALTPVEAVRALLDSPPHCRIVMDARWTRVGLAESNGTAATAFATYWAQVYGR